MIQSESASRDPELAELGSTPCRLQLTKVFPSDCIEMLSTCDSMENVIEQLVQAISRVNRIVASEIDEVVKALLDRERLITSAIGKGLAFPHVRTRIVNEFVGAIGIAHEPIDLGALDGRPTKLVLLVLSPWDQRDAHLGLLSRLVTLTDDKVVTMRMHAQIHPQDVWGHLQDLDDRSGSGG